jgi:aminoglycoside phosphotransferase (APT) family kinase protein
MNEVRDPQTQRVSDWLEEHVGGRVVTLERQARWRPQWFADVERGSELIPLLVRGERTDTAMTWSLRHEHDFQRLMQDHGIKVPKVWGWIDEPVAFVMDRMPGQSDFKGTSDTDRHRVVDEYVQELARLHSLDGAPFVAAGIDHARPGEDPAMVSINRMNVMYRGMKVHPDPQLEFFIDWIERHPPHNDGRAAPVVWDSGQFMHHQGHFGAIIDVELGHVGDPMVDLAGWRMRDSIIPFGDFNRIYDRYAELTGKPVDIDAIQKHHIYFTLSNQLAFSHARREPPTESDFATNMQWCTETNIYATEALAEYLDIELPTVEMPADEASIASVAIDHLVRVLSTVQIADEYARYRIRGAFRTARHVQRVDQIGRQLVEDDVDDLHQLLGRRPADWFAGERELEEFVHTKNGDGRYDDDLCRLFHKRNLRAQMLNGPPGSAMARHNPIQSFRS